MGRDGSRSSGGSGGGSGGRGGGRSGRNNDSSNSKNREDRSGGNVLKVSVHETLYNQHSEVIDVTRLSKREIISRMKRGNVGASQLEQFVSDMFHDLDQLQEEKKQEESKSWSLVSKKPIKKASAQRQQVTGIAGQRGRGAMCGNRGDCGHFAHAAKKMAQACAKAQAQAAANKKAAKAQAQAQAATNKKTAVAAAAVPPPAAAAVAPLAAAVAPPPAIEAPTAATAVAPDAAKAAAAKKQSVVAATHTQAARKQAVTKAAKEQKENPSKGINMGKWAQLAEPAANFSFGVWDDDKDGKKKQTTAPACQMINENENEAVQFILRDSSCLNSVKKDGNFLRDVSSHEESADDGSFKGENGKGKGEGEKMRTMSEEEETSVANKSWWSDLEKCLCTGSKIESILTMEEVERQVMHDHDKRQTALCHFIVFGYENENENKAAQFILHDLHSERSLKSVKNDDNSSRDEISHEPSAYDDAHKEEKEEVEEGGGEKKKKKDAEEQNMQKNEEEEVFKSMPVIVRLTPLAPLPLLKKKNCSLTSVDSGETFQSLVERQRGVAAYFSWTLCWMFALLCLCVCFVPGGMEGSLVLLEHTLRVMKTVPSLEVPSMPVSASFLHQYDNTTLTHLDHVPAAPCILLLPPIVSIDRMVVPHEDALSPESICQRTSIFENMKKKIHRTFFYFF